MMSNRLYKAVLIFSYIAIVFVILFVTLHKLSSQECEKAQRIEKGQVAKCSGDLVPKDKIAKMIATIETSKQLLVLSQETCASYRKADKKLFDDLIDASQKRCNDLLKTAIENSGGGWFSKNSIIMLGVGVLVGAGGTALAVYLIQKR